MSRLSIQDEQIRVVPDNTPGQNMPQGRCLYPVTLYDEWGEYGHGERPAVSRRQFFMVPNQLEIKGVREGDFYQETSLTLSSSPIVLGDLGITVFHALPKPEFYYTARFDLVDAASAAAGRQVRYTPDYLSFTNNGIYVQGKDERGRNSGVGIGVVGGSTTNTVTTSTETREDRTVASWETYEETWINEAGTKQTLVEKDYSSVGTDLSDQVPGSLTTPNVVRALGALSNDLIETPGTAGVPSAFQAGISKLFRDDLPTSAQYFSAADMSDDSAFFHGITNYEIVGGSRVYATRDFTWSRNRSNVQSGREGTYRIKQVRKVTTTTTTTTVPGTEIQTTRIYMRLSMYDQEGNTVVTTQRRLPSQSNLALELFSFSDDKYPGHSIGIDINPYQENLRYFQTSLPRAFFNKAETQYLIRRNAADVLPLSLSVWGASISIPANATVQESDGRLTYDGDWDGTTFKTGRVRCPAWLIYWVLTDPLFGVNYGPDDFDLDSFYQASLYNNELVDVDGVEGMRWPYDGLLNGSVGTMVADLLSCCRGILSQNSEGKWVLSQERPTNQTRWIIAEDIGINGRLTYALATAKPAIQATYFSNITGAEATTKRRGLGDTQETYPGQDFYGAQRWADWRTFETQQLSDSVEFSVPLILKNNMGATIDFYRLQLFDIIEIYDSAVAGIRLAGLTTAANQTDQWVQIDRVPMELFGGGQIIGGTGPQSNWMRLNIPASRGIRLTTQLQDGGVLSALVTQLEWNPSDLRQNKVHYRGHTESIPSGTVWALKIQDIQPRTYRVVSIAKQNGGLSYQITARPYYQGMHEHVETGAALSVAPFVWNPPCGTDVSTFQGYTSDVHTNYAATIDDWKEPIDSWRVPVDEIQGFISNLASSCPSS